jgi:hypothetical protein
MTERQLRSRCISVVGDVEETIADTGFNESETNNASQEAELDGAIVETNGEMYNGIDRHVKDSSNSSVNVVMSAIKFQEFMSNEMV